jgi:hypothetical protein
MARFSASEEESMSLVLSNKAAKLMKLCEIEGSKTLDQILSHSGSDSGCPAICMTEGCDHTTETKPDQSSGVCEACGGHTVASALVLAQSR